MVLAIADGLEGGNKRLDAALKQAALLLSISLMSRLSIGWKLCNRRLGQVLASMIPILDLDTAQEEIIGYSPNPACAIGSDNRLPGIHHLTAHRQLPGSFLKGRNIPQHPHILSGFQFYRVSLRGPAALHLTDAADPDLLPAFAANGDSIPIHRATQPRLPIIAPILPAGAFDAHLRLTLRLIVLPAAALRLGLSPHGGGGHPGLSDAR